MKSLVKKFKFLLPFFVSFFISYYIYKGTNWQEVLSIIVGAKKKYVFLFLFCFVPQFLIAAFRWKRLLELIGDVSIPYTLAFNTLVGSYTLNLIVPGKVGEVVRGFWLRKNVGTAKVLFALIWEKLIDVNALLLFFNFGVVLLLIKMTYPAHLIFDLIIFVITIFFWFFWKKFIVLLSRIKHKKIELITSFLNDFFLDESKSKGHLQIYLIGFIFWAMQLMQFYFAFKMFGQSPQLATLLLTIPLALMVGILPIALMGIGTRDVFLKYYFGTEFSQEVIFCVSLVCVLRIFISGIAGIPSLSVMTSKVGMPEKLNDSLGSK